MLGNKVGVTSSRMTIDDLANHIEKVGEPQMVVDEGEYLLNIWGGDGGVSYISIQGSAVSTLLKF